MEKIKDENLFLYLKTVLNKDEINDEDIKKITVLKFDSISYFDGSYHEIDLSILYMFPNLEEVIINNSVLSNENLSYLKNTKISSVYFNKCAFENNIDFSLLSNMKNISLYNCYVDNYNFLIKLKNIESLKIIVPGDDNVIDISFISKSIKDLTLERCIITNFEFLKEMNQCRTLSLLGTDLEDFDISILGDMRSLNELFISEKYLYDDRLDSLRKNIIIKTNLNEFVMAIDEKIK